MKRLIPFAALLLLAGCGKFEDDMKMFCDASTHVSPNLNPKQRAEETALYISQNVKSQEGRLFFQKLGNAAKEDRAKLLDDAVKKAGLEPSACPTLKQFE